MVKMNYFSNKNIEIVKFTNKRIISSLLTI